MSKMVDDLNDMGRELNDACEPDSGDMMFKAADLLAQVEAKLAESEGQADYDRCTVDALVSDSKILTDKLAEAERERDERDELVAHCERLRLALIEMHKSKYINSGMNTVQAQIHAEALCPKINPAISLANIEARAIEDAADKLEVDAMTTDKVTRYDGLILAVSELRQQAEDIRNSAKESNDVKA